MKYMLLIYNDPAKQPEYGTPAFDEMIAGFFAFNERAKADGVLLDGEALQNVETATSLRVRAGKVETIDGPFAETREHLGGYYVLDVPDLDAAMTYAALIPTAQYGTIELRPLMDYNPTGCRYTQRRHESHCRTEGDRRRNAASAGAAFVRFDYPTWRFSTRRRCVARRGGVSPWTLGSGRHS